MDSDDRLIEELRGELHRSLSAVRLEHGQREALKRRLLATGGPRWPRWRGILSGRPGRGALAGMTGVAAAFAIAAAVFIPLATTPHPANSSPRLGLALQPPSGIAGSGHAAVAAPGCPARRPNLAASPSQAQLGPGQSVRFTVQVAAGCALSASVTGPGPAAVTVRPLATPSREGRSGISFLVTWIGRTRVGSDGRPVASGTYRITLAVGSARERETITVTVR
ncbi:MAG TPA: hypothetical protein VI138_01045 [Candidatus Dormibacteraeota bacterium]